MGEIPLKIRFVGWFLLINTGAVLKIASLPLFRVLSFLNAWWSFVAFFSGPSHVLAPALIDVATFPAGHEPSLAYEILSLKVEFGWSLPRA